MGTKDMSEKLLLDYADVFADVYNVFLFMGEQVIQPEDLKEANIKSQYKADDGVLHEQERDVAKYWEKGCVLAMCGLENQTKIYPYMPVRIISYEGASYRSQLLRKGDEWLPDRIYPVVTMVFNYSNQRWNRADNLKDCMEIPKPLVPYVNDYKIHVFDIAFLEEEVIQRFQSDFRFVAEYFTKTRVNPKYRPSEETIRHKDAVMKLLTAMTGDERYTRYYEEAVQEGEENAMCYVLDGIEEYGRSQGRTEGRKEEQREIITRFIKSGTIDMETIAEGVGVSVEIVKEIAEEMEQL